MKYLITIFLLFIIFSIIKCQTPPRCLYSDIYAKSSHTNLKPTENYVDWWIYEHFYKATKEGKKSGSSFYTDSNLKDQNEKILELSEYDMRAHGNKSPINKTFEQATDVRYSSIFYNNGFKDDYFKGNAHEKGFFIWNDQGGIHVIHSIPDTPQKMDNFFLHSSEDKYLQHSICISLTPTELDIIPKFLIYTNPTIVAINSKILPYEILSSVPNAVESLKGVRNIDLTEKFATVTDADIEDKKQFTDIDTIIMNEFIVNSILPRNIKIFQWAKLADHVAGNVKFSSNPNFQSYHYYKAKQHSFGEYFVQTPIPKKKRIISEPMDPVYADMNNIEHIWQHIGVYYSNIKKWMSQTMTKNTGFAKTEVTSSGTSFSITYRLNYPFLFATPQRSASSDHSKLMYGTSNDGKQKIFCLGGLNWQYVQESRGGGAFCMDGVGYLVDYMERHVSWTRKGISKSDAIIGIPHSTIGTEIDFSWIMNQMTTLNLDTPMGFEILTPKTQNPYPKRIIETELSDYITKTAPLLVETDALLGYKTEAISIDVFPSIKDRVHICPNLEICTYESSVKSNIISNINLIVKSESPRMTITSNANHVITIPQELRDHYFSVRATEIIAQSNGINIDTNKIDRFNLLKTQNALIFDFSKNLNTQCKVEGVGEKGIHKVEFHETCIDQLIYCLFNYYEWKSILNNNIDPVFDGSIDQASFHNDVTKILNVFFPNIQDISRCVVKPPPPGLNNDGQQIDKAMESRTSTEI
ncbi:hypothetical protein ACTFIY_000942 [Dictyostelium cf. discoideum]